MAKSLHKFEKVLAKHSFNLISVTDNVFCGKAYKDYCYKNDNYEGVISVMIWENDLAISPATHYFKQSNGITAPSRCDTAPQLDRNLTRHYIEKIYG